MSAPSRDTAQPGVRPILTSSASPASTGSPIPPQGFQTSPSRFLHPLVGSSSHPGYVPDPALVAAGITTESPRMVIRSRSHSPIHGAPLLPAEGVSPVIGFAAPLATTTTILSPQQQRLALPLHHYSAIPLAATSGGRRCVSHSPLPRASYQPTYRGPPHLVPQHRDYIKNELVLEWTQEQDFRDVAVDFPQPQTHHSFITDAETRPPGLVGPPALSPRMRPDATVSHVHQLSLTPAPAGLVNVHYPQGKTLYNPYNTTETVIGQNPRAVQGLLDAAVSGRVPYQALTPVSAAEALPHVLRQFGELSEIYEIITTTEKLILFLTGHEVRVPMERVVHQLVKVPLQVEVKGQIPRDQVRLSRQMLDLMDLIIACLIGRKDLRLLSVEELVRICIVSETAEKLVKFLDIREKKKKAAPKKGQKVHHIKAETTRDAVPKASVKASQQQKGKKEQALVPVDQTNVTASTDVIATILPTQFTVQVTVDNATDLPIGLADNVHSVFVMLSTEDQHVSTSRIVAKPMTSADPSYQAARADWSEMHTFHPRKDGTDRRLLLTAVSQKDTSMEVLGYAYLDMMELPLEKGLCSVEVPLQSPQNTPAGKVNVTLAAEAHFQVGDPRIPCALRVTAVKGLSFHPGLANPVLEFRIGDQSRQTKLAPVVSCDVTWNEHFVFVIPLLPDGHFHHDLDLHVRLLDASREPARQIEDLTIPLWQLPQGVPTNRVLTTRDGTQLYIRLRAGAYPYEHARVPVSPQATPVKSAVGAITSTSQIETSAPSFALSTPSAISIDTQKHETVAGIVETDYLVLLNFKRQPMYDSAGRPVIIRRHAGVKLPTSDYSVLWSTGAADSPLMFSTTSCLLDESGQIVMLQQAEELAWSGWNMAGSGDVYCLTPAISAANEVMYTVSGAPILVEDLSQEVPRSRDYTLDRGRRKLKMYGPNREVIRIADKSIVTYGNIPDWIRQDRICALWRAVREPTFVATATIIGGGIPESLEEKKDATQPAQQQNVVSAILGGDSETQVQQWRSVDWIARPISLLVDSERRPVVQPIGWPVTVWSYEADRSNSLRTVPLPSETLGEAFYMAGPDGSPLKDTLTGKKLTSESARKAAYYVCCSSVDGSSRLHTTSSGLLPVIDSAGRVVYSKDGKIVLVRQNKEYVRDHNGRKVVDSFKMPISQRRACAFMGVSRTEFIAIPKLDNSGDVARDEDGNPILAARPRNTPFLHTGPTGAPITDSSGIRLHTSRVQQLVSAGKATVLSRRIRDAVPAPPTGTQPPSVLLDQHGKIVYDYTGWPVIIRPYVKLPASVRVYTPPVRPDMIFMKGPSDVSLRNARTGKPMTYRRARRLARCIASIPSHRTVQPLVNVDAQVVRDDAGNPLFERKHEVREAFLGPNGQPLLDGAGKVISVFQAQRAAGVNRTQRDEWNVELLCDDEGTPILKDGMHVFTKVRKTKEEMYFKELYDGKGRAVSITSVKEGAQNGSVLVLTAPRVSRTDCDDYSSSSDSCSSMSDVDVDAECGPSRFQEVATIVEESMYTEGSSINTHILTESCALVRTPGSPIKVAAPVNFPAREEPASPAYTLPTTLAAEARLEEMEVAELIGECKVVKAITSPYKKIVQLPEYSGTPTALDEVFRQEVLTASLDAPIPRVGQDLIDWTRSGMIEGPAGLAEGAAALTSTAGGEGQITTGEPGVVRLHPAHRELTVEIIKAVNLEDTQTRVPVAVKFNVGEQEQSSTFKSSFPLPVWEESFTFTRAADADLTETLGVALTTEDHVIIAERRLPLKNLIDGSRRVIPIVLQAKDEDGKTVTTGNRIMVAVAPRLSCKDDVEKVVVRDTAEDIATAIGFGPISPFKSLTVNLLHAVQLESEDEAVVCKLSVGKHGETSQAMAPVPLPTWNETYTFPVIDESRETLNIVMYRSDGSTAGSHRLKLDTLKRGVKKDVQVTLQRRNPETGQWEASKPPNCIHIALTANGFGRTGHIPVVMPKDLRKGPVYVGPAVLLPDKRGRKAGDSSIVTSLENIRLTMADAGTCGTRMDLPRKMMQIADTTTDSSRLACPLSPDRLGRKSPDVSAMLDDGPLRKAMKDTTPALSGQLDLEGTRIVVETDLDDKRRIPLKLKPNFIPDRVGRRAPDSEIQQTPAITRKMMCDMGNPFDNMGLESLRDVVIEKPRDVKPRRTPSIREPVPVDESPEKPLEKKESMMKPPVEPELPAKPQSPLSVRIDMTPRKYSIANQGEVYEEEEEEEEQYDGDMVDAGCLHSPIQSRIGFSAKSFKSLLNFGLDLEVKEHSTPSPRGGEVEETGGDEGHDDDSDEDYESSASEAEPTQHLGHVLTGIPMLQSLGKLKPDIDSDVEEGDGQLGEHNLRDPPSIRGEVIEGSPINTPRLSNTGITGKSMKSITSVDLARVKVEDELPSPRQRIGSTTSDADVGLGEMSGIQSPSMSKSGQSMRSFKGVATAQVGYELGSLDIPTLSPDGTGLASESTGKQRGKKSYIDKSEAELSEEDEEEGPLEEAEISGVEGELEVSDVDLTRSSSSSSKGSLRQVVRKTSIPKEMTTVRPGEEADEGSDMGEAEMGEIDGTESFDVTDAGSARTASRVDALKQAATKASPTDKPKVQFSVPRAKGDDEAEEGEVGFGGDSSPTASDHSRASSATSKSSLKQSAMKKQSPRDKVSFSVPRPGEEDEPAEAGEISGFDAAEYGVQETPQSRTSSASSAAFAKHAAKRVIPGPAVTRPGEEDDEELAEEGEIAGIAGDLDESADATMSEAGSLRTPAVSGVGFVKIASKKTIPEHSVSQTRQMRNISDSSDSGEAEEAEIGDLRFDTYEGAVRASDGAQAATADQGLTGQDAKKGRTGADQTRFGQKKGDEDEALEEGVVIGGAETPQVGKIDFTDLPKAQPAATGTSGSPRMSAKKKPQSPATSTSVSVQRPEEELSEGEPEMADLEDAAALEEAFSVTSVDALHSPMVSGIGFATQPARRTSIMPDAMGLDLVPGPLQPGEPHPSVPALPLGGIDKAKDDGPETGTLSTGSATVELVDEVKPEEVSIGERLSSTMSVTGRRSRYLSHDSSSGSEKYIIPKLEDLTGPTPAQQLDLGISSIPYISEQPGPGQASVQHPGGLGLPTGTQISPRDKRPGPGAKPMPGDAGFIPPYPGAVPQQAVPIPAIPYDSNYRDAAGRKPGERGFVPPAAARAGKTAADMYAELPAGYDGDYHDLNGRRAGEAGFVPPAAPYGAEYQDAQGRRPGERGFIPPTAAAQGKTAEDMMAILPGGFDENFRDQAGRKPGDAGFIPPSASIPHEAAPLPAGAYDNTYRDVSGRKPGDRGFIPPAAARAGKTAVDMYAELPEGYDANYRDAAGRQPSDHGFIPPTGVYGPEYRDVNGRRPGEFGFIPPAAATEGKTAAEMMALLPAGFDQNYRDQSGRRPGDAGFVPPAAAAVPQQGAPLPAIPYDSNYRDAAGRKPGDRGFVPPTAARAGRTAADMYNELPAGYDSNYHDSNGRRAGEPGFMPPVFSDEFAGSPAQPGYATPMMLGSPGEAKPTSIFPDLYSPAAVGVPTSDVTGDMAGAFVPGALFGADYQDAAGRKRGEVGFVPPSEVGQQQAAVPLMAYTGPYSLEVTLQSAVPQLQGAQWTGCYCLLKVGSTVRRSRSSASVGAPVWFEKFSFDDVDPISSTLDFTVHDCSSGTSMEVGKARISVDGLQVGDPNDFQIAVVMKDDLGQWTPTGTVSLKLELKQCRAMSPARPSPKRTPIDDGSGIPTQGLAQSLSRKASQKKLIVTVRDAESTPADEQPVHVKLSLAQSQEQRSVPRPLANPAWNETFTFDVDDEGAQTLDVSLSDSSGKLLGMSRLKLHSLPRQQTQQVTADLFTRDEDGKWILSDNPVRLNLNLTAENFGRSVVDMATSPTAQTPDEEALTQMLQLDQSGILRPTSPEGSPVRGPSPARTKSDESWRQQSPGPDAVPPTSTSPTSMPEAETPIVQSLVEIWLLEAVNISAGPTGRRDSFVRFAIGDAKQESRVVPNSLNPVWNQRFELPVRDPPSQPLYVSVWDNATGDPLGWFTLKLDTLPGNTPVDVPLPLLLKNEAGEWTQPQPATMLMLSVTARNFGITETSPAKPKPSDSPPKHTNFRVRCLDATGVSSIPAFAHKKINARLQMGQKAFSTLSKSLVGDSVRWGQEFGFEVQDARLELLKIILEDEDGQEVARCRTHIDHLSIGTSRTMSCRLFVKNQGGQWQVSPTAVLNLHMMATGAPFLTPEEYGMPNLQVTLLDAESLLVNKEHKNGLRNPYAVIMIGPQRRHSRVIENTLRPNWNETFEFTVTDPQQQTLDLMIFDRNRSRPSDEDIGRYRLVIGDLRQSLPKKVACRIMLRNPVTNEWERTKPPSSVRLLLQALDSPFPPGPTEPQSPTGTVVSTLSSIEAAQAGLKEIEDLDVAMHEYESSVYSSRSHTPTSEAERIAQSLAIEASLRGGTPVEWGGKVFFQSCPSNATVVVNGVTMGKTQLPWLRGIPGQLYHVTYLLPGYADINFTMIYPPKGEIVRYHRAFRPSGTGDIKENITDDELETLRTALRKVFVQSNVELAQQDAAFDRVSKLAHSTEHEYRLLLELYEAISTENLIATRSKATQCPRPVHRGTQSIRHGMSTQTAADILTDIRRSGAGSPPLTTEHTKVAATQSIRPGVSTQTTGILPRTFELEMQMDAAGRWIPRRPYVDPATGKQMFVLDLGGAKLRSRIPGGRSGSFESESIISQLHSARTDVSHHCVHEGCCCGPHLPEVEICAEMMGLAQEISPPPTMIAHTYDSMQNAISFLRYSPVLDPLQSGLAASAIRAASPPISSYGGATAPPMMAAPAYAISAGAMPPAMYVSTVAPTPMSMFPVQPLPPFRAPSPIPPTTAGTIVLPTAGDLSARSATPRVSGASTGLPKTGSAHASPRTKGKGLPYTRRSRTPGGPATKTGPSTATIAALRAGRPVSHSPNVSSRFQDPYISPRPPIPTEFSYATSSNFGAASPRVPLGASSLSNAQAGTVSSTATGKVSSDASITKLPAIITSTPSATVVIQQLQPPSVQQPPLSGRLSVPGLGAGGATVSSMAPTYVSGTTGGDLSPRWAADFVALCSARESIASYSEPPFPLPPVKVVDASEVTRKRVRVRKGCGNCHCCKQAQALAEQQTVKADTAVPSSTEQSSSAPQEPEVVEQPVETRS